MEATTIKEYKGYTIERYTYAADISATEKPLILYEVYDGVTAELVEAFKTLEEAVDYIDNQAAWNELIAALPVMAGLMAW